MNNNKISLSFLVIVLLHLLLNGSAIIFVRANDIEDYRAGPYVEKLLYEIIEDDDEQVYGVKLKH